MIFQFAGQQVLLNASTETVELLNYVYGQLTSADWVLQETYWSLTESTEGFLLKDHAQKIRADLKLRDREQLIPLFGSFLLIAAIEMNPNLRVLHGQLLQNADHTLILLGSKGVGKTTLTLKLLENSWSSLCEDMIPVDLEEQIVFPYQRAFSIKKPTPLEQHQIRVLGGKAWMKHSSPQLLAPFSLSKTCLVQMVRDQPEKTQSVETTFGAFLLTNSPSSTLQDLHFLPIQQAQERDKGILLRFSRKLTQQEESQFLSRSSTNHLLLTYGEMDSEQGLDLERPAKPFLLPLKINDLAAIYSTNQLSSKAEQTAKINRAYFLLTKSLNVSTLYQLVPGGSVSETLDVLVEAINI